MVDYVTCLPWGHYNFFMGGRLTYPRVIAKGQGCPCAPQFCFYFLVKKILLIWNRLKRDVIVIKPIILDYLMALHVMYLYYGCNFERNFSFGPKSKYINCFTLLFLGVKIVPSNKNVIWHKIRDLEYVKSN